jgi:hypothetical protein
MPSRRNAKTESWRRKAAARIFADHGPAVPDPGAGAKMQRFLHNVLAPNRSEAHIFDRQQPFGARCPETKKQDRMEKAMSKVYLTIAMVALAVGSLVVVSAQAASRTSAKADGAPTAMHHGKRIHRQAVYPVFESTSFSSSSLNVGVNHPPKK